MALTTDDYNYERFLVPHVSRDQIQTILGGMRPRNLENYRRALVHKSIQKHVRQALMNGKQVSSYLVEERQAASNERLEFLGDSVLNIIVGEYIFHKFPGKDEGFMTRLRTKIVRDTHCVKFAQLVGLGDHILAGPVVKRPYNDKLLEDAFEAFLGAIFLDLGFDFARGFVTSLIERQVDFQSLMNDDNYKDILMRYTQQKSISLPIYDLVESENRSFIIDVYLELDQHRQQRMKMGRGAASTKKEAEQQAAFETLKMIDDNEVGELVARDKIHHN